MIVLDTSVLVYAVGEAHTLREPARRVVEAIVGGRVSATTTVEVIQEFAQVRARRRSREDAIRRARSYARLLAPLLVVDADDLERGLEIFGSASRLGAFDAVLAAVALRRRADALISADGGFGSVPHLPWVGLSSTDLDRVLGRGEDEEEN